MFKSMWTTLLLLSFAICCSTVISCSKDKEKASPSNTDLITEKPWKIESSGVDANKDGTIDQADDWSACELDNTFQFVSGGTGISDEGATKCDPSDPQTTNFSWAFKTGETILNLNLPALSISTDANIKTLNESLLEIYKDTTVPGIPIDLRYIFRFKH